MLSILPAFAYFILGLVLQRFLRNTDRWVAEINRFIIYLCLPALIILKVPFLAFSPAVFVPAGAAWLCCLVSIGSVWLIARIVDWTLEIKVAAMLMTTMGNTAFLGLALTQVFLGDDSLGYSIIYDQFGSFLILSTLGIFLVAKYAQVDRASAPEASFGYVLKRILSFPPFISLIVAIVFPIESLVEQFSPMLGFLGGLLLPLALLVLGMQFKPKLLPHHRWPFATVIGIKLILLPIVVFLLFRNAGLDDAMFHSIVFMSAMPSMITPGLLAIGVGIAPRFIATCLAYSALISFATLPLIAHLLN